MYDAILLSLQLFYSVNQINSTNILLTKPPTLISITQKQNLPKSKGDLKNMLSALGVRETGIPSEDLRQYSFINPDQGFLGKYQFAEILLIRLGYYQAKVYFGNGAGKNYWRGTWTGKKGITSKSKFLNSPEVQEAAIREAFSVYYKDINNNLKSRGKSINDYLGKKRSVNYKGKSQTITISLSGILAGAHLQGPNKLVDFLVKGENSSDVFNTYIFEYIEQFGDYNVELKDFFIPNI